MSKRVNYMELLKESVGDRGHDTTKTVDVNGPFLDPILGYDGGGELPTHKDAASILERYYFNQDSDKGVSVTNEDASIPQVGKDKAALPDETIEVDAAKKKIADAVKQEDVDLDGDLLEEDELLEDDVENAVIERLIAEMEEDELLEEDIEQDPVGKTKVHEPSGDPEKDSSGLIDGDKHEGGEGAVKPATFPAGSDGVGKGIKAAMKEDMDLLDEFDELLEMEDDMTAGGKETPEEKAEEKEGDDDKEEDLDVDKEIKESGAPIGNPGTADELEALEEAFDIFAESMEDDDVVDLDDDDIIV